MSKIAVDVLLGQPRRLSDEPQHCSTCEKEIDDDFVPFIVWRNQGQLAYVYCEDCGPMVAEMMLGAMK
jgi:hypothetical protein